MRNWLQWIGYVEQAEKTVDVVRVDSNFGGISRGNVKWYLSSLLKAATSPEYCPKPLFIAAAPASV